MYKQIFALLLIASFYSCNNKLYTDQVKRGELCSYFGIEVGNVIINGKKHITASTQINKIPGNEVSEFLQKHSQRYDYILNKTLTELLKKETNFDSSHIITRFCDALNSDTFYHQLTLLTSGERGNNKKLLHYSIPEMMRTASRFFMCDSIRPKDTAISYHICIGINGIPDLQTTRDYTALEAFCVEAIFYYLKKGPEFIPNFNDYIKKSSARNKAVFTDFKTHLSRVRDECYTAMEKDKDLETQLLKYYRKNTGNINFVIE